jgi:hypothetical protein
MRTAKNWIVVLCEGEARHWCLLGELDRGMRQGVRRRGNATRFTEVGARRVAASYGPGGAYAVREDGARLEGEP